MNNKIIITMPEMMEQMDCCDKTIHEMIDRGDLPDFSYGFGNKTAKKKGWHVAVLERHAMQRYEQSQSIRNARQIGMEDESMTLFRGRNTHNNRKSIKQKQSSKEVCNRRRNSSKKSVVSAGFSDIPD